MDHLPVGIYTKKTESWSSGGLCAPPRVLGVCYIERVAKFQIVEKKLDETFFLAFRKNILKILKIFDFFQEKYFCRKIENCQHFQHLIFFACFFSTKKFSTKNFPKNFFDEKFFDEKKSKMFFR